MRSGKTDEAGLKMLQAVQVQDVTCHFLHGRVITEVGVSLDPKLSIRYDVLVVDSSLRIVVSVNSQLVHVPSVLGVYVSVFLLSL